MASKKLGPHEPVFWLYEAITWTLLTYGQLDPNEHTSMQIYWK